jgi:hypothetical protein
MENGWKMETDLITALGASKRPLGSPQLGTQFTIVLSPTTQLGVVP